MLSRQLTTTILLAVAVVLFAACAPATPTVAPTTVPPVAPIVLPSPTGREAGGEATPTRAPLTPTTAGTLRIGVLPITDVMPFYVAQAQGHFKKQGINVELVPVASAAERDQLMASQQIDGQLNDLVSTVLFNAQSPRIKIVRRARQAFANAPQFFILVTKDSPVKTVQDLKGIEIGISQNSVIEYVTQRLLEKEGLTASDIKTTNIPAIPTRFQLLMQGQLKAANLPDPLASLAILQGARIVIDDGKYPEISQSVISFRSDIVEKRADDVRKFLAAYDQAVQDIRADPNQFRNILIEKGRVPDPLKDKYQFPPFPDPSVPTKAQWDDVVKWAIDRGLVKQAITYESSVDSGFVK
jgi:NitT/TauT family transport system substrate-binding protein